MSTLMGIDARKPVFWGLRTTKADRQINGNKFDVIINYRKPTKNRKSERAPIKLKQKMPFVKYS